MNDTVPAVLPTQFESESIGKLSQSVNMFRGSVNVTKTLVNLPGKPGDSTLSVSLAMVSDSDVSQQALQWNLSAPTGTLGLGWSIARSRITAQTSGALSPYATSYSLEYSNTSTALIEDDQPWLRVALDAAVAATPASGTVSTAVVQAFAAQSVLLDASATLTADGQNWTLTDAVGEHVFSVQPGGSGADVYDGVRRWPQLSGAELPVLAHPVLPPVRAVGDHDRLGGGPGLRRRQDHGGQHLRQHRQQHRVGRRLDERRLELERPVAGRRRPVPVRRGLEPLHSARPLGLAGRLRLQRVPPQRGVARQQRRTPADQPETPPVDLGLPGPYQDCYETLYLQQVTVDSADGDRLYSLAFEYPTVQAVSGLTGPLQVTAAKRYLGSVTETNPHGASPGGFSYTYSLDGPNYGALASVTYPQGAVAPGPTPPACSWTSAIAPRQ